jgi:hypothetical protein
MKVGRVSEKPMTQKQLGRVGRTRNQLSAPKRFVGDCSGNQFLASNIAGALGCVR